MRQDLEQAYEWQVELIAQNIGDFCRKWGRINVTQTKEKYGTCRVYCSFGWMSLHSLVKPGYVYNQFPNWLFQLDNKVLTPVLNKLVQPWFIYFQYWIYKKAYAKFTQGLTPEQKRDIYRFADYEELL